MAQTNLGFTSTPMSQEAETGKAEQASSPTPLALVHQCQPTRRVPIVGRMSFIDVALATQFALTASLVRNKMRCCADLAP